MREFLGAGWRSRKRFLGGGSTVALGWNFTGHIRAGMLALTARKSLQESSPTGLRVGSLYTTGSSTYCCARLIPLLHHVQQTSNCSAGLRRGLTLLEPLTAIAIVAN